MLGISPRVEISPDGAWDSAQLCLANVMRGLGGVQVANPYLVDFFLWRCRQIIAIDDYPYERIDFHEDPNIPLPPGLEYGDIGNESQLNFVF